MDEEGDEGRVSMEILKEELGGCGLLTFIHFYFLFSDFRVIYLLELTADAFGLRIYRYLERLPRW